MKKSKLRNLIAYTRFFVLAILIIGSVLSVCAQKRQSSYNNIPNVDYCKLLGSDRYNLKLVRTTAVLNIVPVGEPRIDGASDDYFFSTKCNGPDNFALAEYSNGSYSSLSNLLKADPQAQDVSTVLFITFVAKFDSANFPTFGELGWLRAELKIKKIEQVWRVKDQSLKPDHKTASPVIDSGTSLRWASSSLIFSFFRRSTEMSLEGLATEKTKYFLNGKTVKKIDFTNWILTNQRGDTGVRTSKIIRSQNLWRVSGWISNEIKDSVKSKLYYDYDFNFVKSGDLGWKLLSIKLVARKPKLIETN